MEVAGAADARHKRLKNLTLSQSREELGASRARYNLQNSSTELGSGACGLRSIGRRAGKVRHTRKVKCWAVLCAKLEHRAQKRKCEAREEETPDQKQMLATGNERCDLRSNKRKLGQSAVLSAETWNIGMTRNNGANYKERRETKKSKQLLPHAWRTSHNYKQVSQSGPSCNEMLDSSSAAHARFNTTQNPCGWRQATLLGTSSDLAHGAINNQLDRQKFASRAKPRQAQLNAAIVPATMMTTHSTSRVHQKNFILRGARKIVSKRLLLIF